MPGITVKELAYLASELTKQGFGNKKVLISSDDEGNEYHTLYYPFIIDEETIRQISDYTTFYDVDNVNDVVLLG